MIWRIRSKEHKLKGHLCRLPFDVRPHNVKLNLSIVKSQQLEMVLFMRPVTLPVHFYFIVLRAVMWRFVSRVIYSNSFWAVHF